MNSRLETILVFSLIGVEILFVLTASSIFLYSLWAGSTDMLIPLKALVIAVLGIMVSADIATFYDLGWPASLASLILEILGEGVLLYLVWPTLSKFFHSSKPFSLTQYGSQFKVFPTIGLFFAVVGVLIVTYYSLK